MMSRCYFSENIPALLTLIILLLLSLSVVLADGTSDDGGLSYLESNAKEPGVVVLPSGLQYKILRHGIGEKHPLEKTSCSFHFRARLATTGKIFDSSYDRDRPIDIRTPEQVIKGWSEAMKLMREGDIWELTIPPHLAYGDREFRGSELIPANSVLIYEMELLEMFGPTTPALSPCTVISSSSSSSDDNDDNDTQPLVFVECNANEETYARKVNKDWSSEKLKSEILRLLGIKEEKSKGKVKKKLIDSIHRRLRILNYLVSFENNNIQYYEGQDGDTEKFDWAHDHDHGHGHDHDHEHDHDYRHHDDHHGHEHDDHDHGHHDDHHEHDHGHHDIHHEHDHGHHDDHHDGHKHEHNNDHHGRDHDDHDHGHHDNHNGHEHDGHHEL